MKQTQLTDYIEKLTDIGILLSKEQDLNVLLHKILLSLIDLTYADGGSIYLVENKQMIFYYMQNKSLGLSYDNQTIPDYFSKSIPLYLKDGKKNMESIITNAIHNDKTINIKSAEKLKKYYVAGIKKYDELLKYKTHSILTVPMHDYNKKIIGGIQLVNAIDPKTKNIIAFDAKAQSLAESLASQASIILTQKQLIKSQKELFDGLTELIAVVIDHKSPYTSRHCERVPIICELITKAIQDKKTGCFKHKKFSEDELYEIKVASWLHDCGKLVTPIHVLDKATKLSTVVDRVEIIKAKFEIIYRDLKIKSKNGVISNEIKEKILDDIKFIENINYGKEFLQENEVTRLKKIFESYHWTDLYNKENKVMNEKDLENLLVHRGTLNNEERELINSHVTATSAMLSSLKFPEHLENVPMIAGMHHEYIDGSGYPKKLVGSQVLLQSRIITIADIFEALTSSDRPYKPGKTISQALEIMNKMRNEGKIDSELLDLFVEDKIYDKYAEEFLAKEQQDLPPTI